MTTILSAMKKRQTIRRYKTDPINEELVEQLLESVQCSQSWANTQCWELVLVTNDETKKAMQEAVPKQNPAFAAVVEAPLVIALCAQTDKVGYIGNTHITTPGDWFMFDAGLATQNLCNCAAELGLGTVVVGWLDHDRLKRVIGLPQKVEAVALIPVGYPEQIGVSPPRKAVSEFVHVNRFGNAYPK
ncbi:MAG: nitroreductase family protein [Deltaproteobacteria bacterium]|nr:nitroreductase family protein [Deltaproteobacteria bacterium]